MGLTTEAISGGWATGCVPKIATEEQARASGLITLADAANELARIGISMGSNPIRRLQHDLAKRLYRQGFPRPVIVSSKITGWRLGYFSPDLIDAVAKLRAPTIPRKLPTEVVAYLDTVEAAGRDRKTIREYRLVLSKLPNPAGASSLDIRDLLNSCRSLNTRALYFTVLRQFYRFCMGRGLIESDPSAGIKTPKTRRREYGGVTEEQFRRLQTLTPSAETDFVWTLATVLYRVGPRISETLAIRAEHVTLDGDTGTIDFPRRKGGSAGYAAFGPEVATVLRAWLPTHPTWLFPHHKDPTRPMTPPAAWQRLTKAGKAVGIPGRLNAHRFRHSFITRAVDAGWHQLLLQQQVGHSNPSSTARYFHPSKRGLIEAYGRAWGGGMQ